MAAASDALLRSGGPGGASLPALGEEDLARFREQGFLVVRDMLDAAAVERLKAEGLALVRGQRGRIKGLDGDLGRGTDADALSRCDCIHYPHKVSPAVMELVRHPPLVSLLQRLIGPNLKAVHSMMFFKPPGLPGQAMHQDEFFLPTRDRSLTAVWIALDDADEDNGCLRFVPGSHRRGVLYPHAPNEDPRYDASFAAYGHPWTDADAVLAPMPAGSAAIFNGYCLHGSLPNLSRRLRRAVAVDYMAAETLFPFLRNADQAVRGYLDDRDVVLVAGEDPYGAQGTVDLNVAQIRYVGSAPPPPTGSDGPARIPAAAGGRPAAPSLAPDTPGALRPRDLAWAGLLARADGPAADPWAATLAGPEGLALADELARALPELAVWAPACTALVDGVVRRFAAEATGPRQVVLLGPGLGTRPARLRHPWLRWFEADTTAALAERARRLLALPDHPRGIATRVVADPAAGDALAALVAHGLSVELDTLFVLEGAAPWLAPAALEHLLVDVAARCAKGSTVAFDHLTSAELPPSVEAAAALLSEAEAHALRDPLPLVYRAGFRRLRTVGLAAGAASIEAPIPDASAGAASFALSTATVRGDRAAILVA